MCPLSACFCPFVRVQQYEADPAKQGADAQVALAPLIKEALTLSKLKEFTGRDAPTVRRGAPLRFHPSAAAGLRSEACSIRSHCLVKLKEILLTAILIVSAAQVIT